MTHLQRRCLQMFCHQIVYLVEYKQGLEDLSLIQIPQINQGLLASDIYNDIPKGRILGSICTKTWILQPELYSVFEQTLQRIHVEQKRFASRIIRRVWTIYALFFALHRCRHIPMSTIANMFTDNKEWNDILVRDFTDKWYK